MPVLWVVVCSRHLKWYDELGFFNVRDAQWRFPICRGRLVYFAEACCLSTMERTEEWTYRLGFTVFGFIHAMAVAEYAPLREDGYLAVKASYV